MTPGLTQPGCTNDRAALDVIVSGMDIIRVGGEEYILCPAPPRLIDYLAAYRSDGAERAPADEDEDDPEENSLQKIAQVNFRKTKTIKRVA